MDHPNIASVFDGGLTDDGYPFFVMELVKGDPITDFCDRNRLTIDRRVELMVEVCGAIQHAHTKGVVHRDLKPSNILVSYDADGRARPKVIDFGVAKALNQRLSEQTIFTDRGQLIGTPEYMSPEQAEMSGLDIDTRADVYSLGVLLYELLTGVLPFDPRSLRDAGFGEIQRMIREVDPPKPSTRLSTVLASRDDPDTGARITRARRADARSLTGVLKRDLDWVVMKCLEKDRERRYDTANAVAMELRRYLKGEPVVVGPPSGTYRLAKAIDRASVLKRLSGLLIAACGMVFAVCVVSIALLLFDVALQLQLFGHYGPGGLDLRGAASMNVYGAGICGITIVLARHIPRRSLGAAIVCVLTTGLAAAWAMSMFFGLCPFTAGDLLADEMFRRMFALIYSVFFSLVLWIACMAVVGVVLVRRFGRLSS
jgi:non-specific serine/threonine protein kinase/serine/threonine-protein kinase